MYWGNKKVIAVGGGKGGIGKSIITANMGILLGRMGKKVLLVDADLGAANLHTMLGIRYPQFTLEDFLIGRKTFKEIILSSKFSGVELISGASEILSLLNPTFKERQKLIRNLQKYEADYIVIDLPAGTDMHAVDFFTLADYGIVVLAPTPTSLENAFSFLKNSLFRGLLKAFYRFPDVRKKIEDASDPRSENSTIHFRDLLKKLEDEKNDVIREFKEQIKNKDIWVLCNAVRTHEQEAVLDKFSKIADEYLGLKCNLLGNLPYDSRMEECVVALSPVVEKFPKTPFEESLLKAINTMLQKKAIGSIPGTTLSQE
jgi:flagellar biosynthesis protein FlhG